MKQNPHLPGTPDEFIQNNLDLAHKVAWKFIHVVNANPTGFDMDDIISISYEGLVKAYKAYDPSRFEKVNYFSTYAVPTIYGHVSREIRDRNYTIRPRRGDKAKSVESLDKTIFEKEKEITLGDMLQTEDDLTEVIVRDFYKSLNDREKKVYLMRCKCGLSQTEAGKRLGIAQVLVSRAERSMLDKARRYGEERMCC